ncbi:MAG: hypothetical protein BIFFINMI_03166 [Phycisphaerae bacterium]|nr:hypothetical protein [Phycisphaerae bacterium]
MVEKKEPAPGAAPASPQASEQAGTQVRVRVDERELTTSYANAFRTNGTPDEVILDLGLNLVNQGAQPDSQPEILLKLTHRVILNYYSAKRLAITLSQLVRRHEEQFGELELDANKRARRTQAN